MGCAPSNISVEGSGIAVAADGQNAVGPGAKTDHLDVDQADALIRRRLSNSRAPSAALSRSASAQNMSISIIQPDNDNLDDLGAGGENSEQPRGLLANIFTRGLQGEKASQVRPTEANPFQSLKQLEAVGQAGPDDQRLADGSQNIDMIRMDLSQNKIPQTPKNQILLMRLTDQLISYLEQAQEAQMKQQQQKNEELQDAKSQAAKRDASQAKNGSEKVADEGKIVEKKEPQAGEDHRKAGKQEDAGRSAFSGAMVPDNGNTRQLVQGAQEKAGRSHSNDSDANKSSSSSILPQGSNFIKKQKVALKENTLKAENHLDELSHCQYIAGQQLSHFKRNAFIVDLQIQLIRQLRKLSKQQVRNMLHHQQSLETKEGPDSQAKEQDNEGSAELDGSLSTSAWYFEYCRILVKQLVDLIEPLKVLQKDPKLLREFLQSQEVVLLQACLIAIIRFAEGISWGYSPMLMHQAIEKENEYCVRLVINLLATVRQYLREQPQLIEVVNQNSDVQSVYLPRESYLGLEGDRLLDLMGQGAGGAIPSGSDPQGLNLSSDSFFLGNQVFRKTYVQIKRSIDDWLRIKNLKRTVLMNFHPKKAADKNQQAINEKQKVAHSKDIISIQEFVQYKLQYKSFTKNFIRGLKRPPSLDPKKQRQNGVASQQQYYHSYSSVNYTAEEPRQEVGPEGEEDDSFAYEINENPNAVPAAGGKRSNSQSKRAARAAKDGKRTYVVPCSYEIENSKQFLLLTGQSHEEMRIIVESFLQANVKMRTKYKCVCLHHCLLENPSTCDSYNIVRNVLGQIVRAVPFLADYLKVSSNEEFAALLREVTARRTADEEDCSNVQTEKFAPSIFVKFIKRINELRLDFNIVVVITGLEYSFDQDNLQNFVYLLRSAAVYMNQNSFLKFIFTMKSCQEPSSDAMNHIEKLRSHLFADELDDSKSQVSAQLSDLENSRQKDANSRKDARIDLDTASVDQVFEQDLAYQRDVVFKNHQRFQQVQKILQTGAICNVEDGIFFKKNASNFVEFALKYLYPDLYSDEALHQQEQERQKRSQAAGSDSPAGSDDFDIKQMVNKILAKSEGSYHNCIQIIHALCKSIHRTKSGNVPAGHLPAEVVDAHQTEQNSYLTALKEASELNDIGPISIIKFALALQWLAETNSLDGSVCYDDLKYYSDFEDAVIQAASGNEPKYHTSREILAKHVHFARLFDNNLQAVLSSKERRFNLAQVLRIFDKYGIIRLQPDRQKATFVQGYQRQHGLEQAAGVDFSAAQWQAFYHESFVTGKVSDPERTPRRMSATIEYANNFDFGNEAGEARRAQGADQSELDEDRECAYDSSKLGKKVRLAKMLRNKHDGICAAQRENQIANTVVLLRDSDLLQRCLAEFTSRAIKPSELNAKMNQLHLQPWIGGPGRVANREGLSIVTTEQDAEGLAQSTVPSTQQVTQNAAGSGRGNEHRSRATNEKALPSVSFCYYDFYQTLKWLFILQFGEAARMQRELRPALLLQDPLKRRHRDLRLLIDDVIVHQQECEQRARATNLLLCLNLPRIYSIFEHQILLLELVNIEANLQKKLKRAQKSQPGARGPEYCDHFFRLQEESGTQLYQQYSLSIQDLLRLDWQYIMIKYAYRSFNRYLESLKKYSRRLVCTKEKKLIAKAQQGFEMANILASVEQTLNTSQHISKQSSSREQERRRSGGDDCFSFFDFLVQIRGRILKDPHFAKMFYRDEAARQQQTTEHANGTRLAGLIDAVATPNDDKTTKRSRNSSPGRNANPNGKSSPAAGASTQRSPRVTMDEKYEYISEYLAQIENDWFSSSFDSFDHDGESDAELDFAKLLHDSSNGSAHIQSFHHGLRENQRIEIVEKMPGCIVLALKFYQKNSVFASLSNGLILLYDTAAQTVEKIFANKGAIIDCLKVLYPTYLITAGVDSKIRIWNVQTGKLFAKFEIHKHSTQQMIIHNQNLYSYGGHDMKLVKFDIACKETDCWINLKSHITAMKLLKYRSKERLSSNMSGVNQQRGARQETTESQIFSETHIAAAFHDFDVVIYDLDLNQLQQIDLANMTPGDEVIRIIRNSDAEIMCFSNEGAINILGVHGLEEVKSGTIFSLKNEDYIDLLLIKSREYFLFTIERQKIEFYSANHLKRTDSWDYFFQSDIACCHKNREGSKIFVADKAGNCVLFNFIKHLDPSKNLQMPSNRRQDPVTAIEITTDPRKSEDQHLILSCSQDRDLRLWMRKNGLFNKKYDLSSFLGENVQCIRLGKNEDNLFLGSKDMNVYLININKGKLCVVYEGHWNKVTHIYAVPRTDILMTISESNIKVWDLEYDECIKNMNEHSSEIVFIEQLHDDEQQVLTIGEQFELKVWNYVTGLISSQQTIDINKSRKELRTLQILCCDVQDEQLALALNNGEIIVQSVDGQVSCAFTTWQGEEVIFVKQLSTLDHIYLLVVYRTAAFVYQLVPAPHGRLQAVKMCAYYLNAKRSSIHKNSKNTKYNNNARFYFSAARVHLMYDKKRADSIAQKRAQLKNLIAQYSSRISLEKSPQERLSALQNLSSRLWRQVSLQNCPSQGVAIIEEAEDALITHDNDLSAPDNSTENQANVLEDTGEGGLQNFQGANKFNQMPAQVADAGVLVKGNSYSDSPTIQANEMLTIGKEGHGILAVVGGSSVSFNKQNTDMSMSKKSQGVRSVVKQLQNKGAGQPGESNDEVKIGEAPPMDELAAQDRGNEHVEGPYENLLKDGDNSSQERQASPPKVHASEGSQAPRSDGQVPLAPNEIKKQMRRQQQQSQWRRQDLNLQSSQGLQQQKGVKHQIKGSQLSPGPYADGELSKEANEKMRMLEEHIELALERLKEGDSDQLGEDLEIRSKTKECQILIRYLLEEYQLQKNDRRESSQAAKTSNMPSFKTIQPLDSFRDSFYDQKSENAQASQNQDPDQAADNNRRRLEPSAFKVLLCIGDSRGQVHMNHLYLR